MGDTMVKESLKNYLDRYFESYIEKMGSYPIVPFDEDEVSSLYFGEADEEEHIQWKYAEKKEYTDFSDLEKKFGVKIADDIKELYNSYYFLQLQGFWHNEYVYIEEITEYSNIPHKFEYTFENESKELVPIGMYGNMQLTLCLEISTGNLIAVDYEGSIPNIILGSLSKFLDEMTPLKDNIKG